MTNPRGLHQSRRLAYHAPMDSGQKSSVAERWERVTNSPESVYKSVVVPAQKIRYFADSAYVRPIVEATPEGARCLETGCGSGSLSLAVASTGRRVTTIDIAQGVLDNLAANHKRLVSDFPGMGEIDTVRGDIERMPFADGTFAAVFSEGVIEHWVERPARLAVMREMIRVLRPGGRLVLFVPNGRHVLHGWWQLTRYPGYASENEVPWHRFSSAELAGELAEVGLVDVTHDGISPYSTLAIWPNWWILRAAAAVLRRALPEPIWLRRKFGFNLMAAGRKG